MICCPHSNPPWTWILITPEETEPCSGCSVAMLRLYQSTPTVIHDSISRRDWMRVGGLGILVLSLPGMLRAEDAQRRPRNRTATAGEQEGGRAKSCILLWLGGGPSHP